MCHRSSLRASVGNHVVPSLHKKVSCPAGAKPALRFMALLGCDITAIFDDNSLILCLMRLVYSTHSKLPPLAEPSSTAVPYPL